MKKTIAALLAAFVAGGGAGAFIQSETVSPGTKTVKVTAPNICPQAVSGHGSPGACTPPAVKKRQGTLPKAVLAPFGPKFPDFSNNDPCYCGAALRAHGIVGEIDKTNQGTGFIDSTFVPMVRDARAHGLAVGGYDFVQNYNASEAYTFINRLHAAGIYRNSPNTFPPTLDVEYGNYNTAGLNHMINILNREYGRVQIYTGAWYWEPHHGCSWPGGVPGWISGYPSAVPPCGMPSYLFAEHQFSETGFNGATSADLSVYRFSNFNAFVHKNVTPPKPPPTPNQRRVAKEAQLRTVNRRILQLRALEAKHKCRIVHGKRAYGACKVWGPEGQREHRHAARLESEIRALR